ncbi:MAG: hypothetical protein AB1716_24665, partial [Planctomycetota bacterium]
MDERSRQRQFEDRFLRQLRARAQALIRRDVPADNVEVETVPDGVDSVRATLTRLERFDRGLLEQLPGTQAVQLRFQRRVFGPFNATIARLRAQVLASIEELVGPAGSEIATAHGAGEGAPAAAGRRYDIGPVGREQVLDALARYELLPQRERPTAAVFASATGFTPEAKALVHAPGSVALILMGGRPDGGWDVEMSSTIRRVPWAKLFELESQDERLRRLLAVMEKNALDLDSRGLSVPELAEQLGLPVAETDKLIRQACRTDARLLTVMHEGTLHVCRSPLAEESTTMSLRSWIRKLLRMKPTVAERVREMTAQRVRLEQQRHEVDQRLHALEGEEKSVVEQGAAAKSDAERKQLAGKLVRTRRELRRVRAQADIFTQQIDVLGTHIHHLTLEEQGKRIELPSAEELTAEAAQAESMMADLAAKADLAAGIEVGAQSPLMQEEEAAIMEEFKQAAAERAAPVAASEPAA